MLSPLELLPYYLAVEPSPTDGSVALAVVEHDAAGLFVSVVLEDQGARTEVFRFTRFAAVSLTWSPCGRFLAFAQDATLIVRKPGGTLQLCPLADDVDWLGFDRQQRLWALAGGRLEARFEDRVVATVDRVELAAVDAAVVYVRRDRAGLSICVQDGERERVLGCVPEPRTLELVRLSTNGSHVIVVLGGPMVEARVDVRIVRFDVASGASTTLLDRHVAFGFNGGPGMTAVALPGGEVLAAYEDLACTRVWALAPGAAPQPVTPDGYEVFDFAVDRIGTRLAVIASDTRTALGAAERHLLLGQRIGGSWQFAPPVAGVYDRPRWTCAATVEVLCGDGGRWLRRRCDTDAAVAVAPRWCHGIAVSGAGVDYDVLRLPGPRHRRSAIVLLPRLHQQFVAGAQAYFFHHLIFSIAAGLAADGYDVVVLHGPGAVGRGRARREPKGSYMVQLGAAARDLARTLGDEGCRSIGVLAGSMAAVAALRLAGPQSPFSAFAFVAPLLEASIPVTTPLRHLLVDDPAVASLEAAARQLARPVLVVHGARDEVAPISQVSFLARHAAIELCLLEGEGHIFTQPVSWQRTQAAIHAFFATRLFVST